MIKKRLVRQIAMILCALLLVTGCGAGVDGSDDNTPVKEDGTLEVSEESAENAEGREDASIQIIESVADQMEEVTEETTTEEASAEETPTEDFDTAETANVEAEPPADDNPEPYAGYGRILFVGDSRTIDMFADSDAEIRGEEHDGIVVFAGHGRASDYLEEVINSYDPGEYDTLVSWMGANDRGHFSGYKELYENCLANGKTVVVCTVGTQDSSYLKESDIEDFSDEKLQKFNRKLTDWAEERNIRVIDLYSFTRDNITVDPADGIHYLPRPTKMIWDHILEELS
ncbi:MAG: SGNH/GDSL hydrolase family protein [Lachnospiraceae bacterium]|nr:SGNH/GDSL hydrolase family protein [Lachnospiraceae bacterium]